MKMKRQGLRDIKFEMTAFIFPLSVNLRFHCKYSHEKIYIDFLFSCRKINSVVLTIRYYFEIFIKNG